MKNWSSALVYFCERKQKVKTGEAWERGYCINPYSLIPKLSAGMGVRMYKVELHRHIREIYR